MSYFDDVDGSHGSSSSATTAAATPDSTLKSPLKTPLSDPAIIEVEGLPTQYPLSPDHRHNRHPWLRSLSRGMAAKYPRTHARLDKVLSYVRGPRPKVDLPRMSPWPSTSVLISNVHVQHRNRFLTSTCK